MIDLTDGELKSVLASLGMGRIHLESMVKFEGLYDMPSVYRGYVDELDSAEDKLREELHQRSL